MDNANLIRIFVSSPKDAVKERMIICDEIHKLNRIYAHRNNLVLIPFTSADVFSQMGAHPQEVVNSQLLNSCDALIACFKTRFGTPTEKHGSGTEEEIEIHRALNSHVAIFFETQNLNLNAQDDDQLQRLSDFRNRIEKSAYVEEFGNESDLREKISKNIVGYLENLSSSFMLPKTSIAGLFQDIHSNFIQELYKLKVRWNSLKDSPSADQWKEIAGDITESLLEIGAQVEEIMNGRESALQKDIQAMVTQSHKLNSWVFTFGGSNGTEAFIAHMNNLFKNLEVLKEESWESYVATSIPINSNS